MIGKLPVKPSYNLFFCFMKENDKYKRLLHNIIVMN